MLPLRPCRAKLLPIVGVAFVAVCGGWLRAADQGDAQRDLVRVRSSPEEQPWLRINAGGHTAAVQALAFTADSKRLCSAGLDKIVEVWNLSAITRDIRRVFLRERTIRWQVARGLRGSIYALASAPSDGLLALGGYGAMGSLGEILLVNPVDGSLNRVLEGHRQTICSLAFSADGRWLASCDAAGAAILWQRGKWQPVVLYDQDTKTYGAAERRSRLRGSPSCGPWPWPAAATCFCRYSWAPIRPAACAGRFNKSTLPTPRTFARSTLFTWTW